MDAQVNVSLRHQRSQPRGLNSLFGDAANIRQR
jgi:hypothetical protein